MFTAPTPCAGNLLVVPSCDSNVYALNRRTGKPVWKFSEAGGAYHSSPAILGKTIFLGNDDGHLYAVGEVTGALKWRADLNSPIWAAPLLVPGLVVAGTLDGHLFGVRLTDGAILWRAKAGREIYLSSFQYWKETILLGTKDGRILSYDPETGKRRWSLGVKGKVGGGPAREEDTLFLATTNGRCLAYHLAKRRVLWSRRLRGGTIYPPAVTPSLIVVGTGAGQVYGLHRRTGEVVWRFAVKGRAGCCAADGRRLIMCSWNGTVYARSLADGSRLWELSTDSDVRGYPTLSGGWLYIGSLDNSLYAVKYL